MSKILIVGGEGYIGCHANKLLNQQRYETIVYDNSIYGHQKTVKWGDFVLGCLNDIKPLRLLFPRNEIVAVMHFATFAYVGESYESGYL